MYGRIHMHQMVTAKTIPVRLEDELIARLDALAAALTERTAGVKVSRSAAMRAALERGLASLEDETGMSARRRKSKK